MCFPEDIESSWNAAVEAGGSCQPLTELARGRCRDKDAESGGGTWVTKIWTNFLATFGTFTTEIRAMEAGKEAAAVMKM